jgi:hypothetical protein
VRKTLTERGIVFALARAKFELREIGDGSAAYVYRETVIDRPAPSDPTVLVVAFGSASYAGVAMTCSAP